MILDTNAVSALLAGDPGLADVLGPEPRHHLPVIVLGEYRYGLRRSDRRTSLETLLATLVQQCTVLPVDESTTETYAQVRHELREKGRPIPENDVWIAALARQHHQPVVSRDVHFDEVPGLRRLSW